MASILVSKTTGLGSSPSSPAILPGSQAVRHMTLTHGRVGSNPTPAAIFLFKMKGVLYMGELPIELTAGHIETVPHKKLIEYISTSDNQEIVNRCAYELTKRMWVPNREITFDKMLSDFGFRYPDEIEKTEDPAKSLGLRKK